MLSQSLKTGTHNLKTPSTPDFRAQNLAGFSPLIAQYRDNPELQTMMSSILAASTEAAHKATQVKANAGAQATGYSPGPATNSAAEASPAFSQTSDSVLAQAASATTNDPNGKYQEVIRQFLAAIGVGPRAETGSNAGATAGSAIAKQFGFSPEMGAMIGSLFGGSLGGGSLGSIISIASTFLTAHVPADASGQFVQARDV